MEEEPVEKIRDDIVEVYEWLEGKMNPWIPVQRLKDYKKLKNVEKERELTEDENKHLMKLTNYFSKKKDEKIAKLNTQLGQLALQTGNIYKQFNKKISDIYSPNNPINKKDYYAFFEAVHNLPVDIKSQFINDFGKEIKKVYTQDERAPQLTRDFKGKPLDVLDDWDVVKIDDQDKVKFSDLVQALTNRVYTSQELQEATDRAAEEGRMKGREEISKEIEHAPEKISKIYENVENLNKTFNPKPVRDKEGKISAYSLLRNSKSLNEIHKYISRGFADMTEDELLRKLQNEHKSPEDAKAYADAIMIRKAEQQARNKPLYQRLKEARDANLIRNIPEEVQKDLNDYEREDFAKKMRNVENYYLLPHEWKRLKAKRDYGINPMLLRGIIKE